MSFNNEKEFENALIQKLTEIENQWSKDVLNYPTEEELIENWAKILYQNNNTTDKLNGCPLTKTEMQQIINKLDKTPYEINQILNSRYISFVRDNPDDKLHYGKNVYLFIFDKDDIAAGRSVYQIARQPKFKIASNILGTRRGDLTLLINGMPLIHIELKKSGIPVEQACNQISKYMQHGAFTGLFSLIQVFVAMNPEGTVYFANPGRNKKLNPDLCFHWGDFANNHINKWNQVASTLLSIPMAHRLIGYGTISDGKDKTLKVMRSYQYHAAYKIYTRVLERQDWDFDDQKGGYIYHTTGSGKTLTSFKCAQLIKSAGIVDKIVFLMDRTELWKQTYENYVNFSDGEDVEDTGNTSVLVAKLKSEDKSQLIVTSIQKMSNVTIQAGANKRDIEKIQSKRIVFIIDEAHRSTFGTMLRDIKLTYKNAMFFGFTGTPIKEINAIGGITTEGLFGKLLHQYTILEGIRDKNVLGFKPDKVFTFDEFDLKNKVALLKAGISKLSEANEQQFKIYQSWMQKDMIEIEKQVPNTIYSDNYSGEEHRKNVVKNILDKWEALSYRGKFHHILATSSISEAIKYYKLLKNNEKDLFVTAIFDPHTDNTNDDIWKDEAIEEILNDYNEHFGFHFNVGNYKTFKDDVCSRLAHSNEYNTIDEEIDGRINIVIVVNQLLTGFDSKWINVLHLDKLLEYEQFIQAASRTNRLYGHEKPYGTIKYYRKPYTQEHNALEALKLYAEHGYENVFASSLGFNLININKNFEEIEKIYEANKIQNFTRLPDSEYDRKLFVELFNNINTYIYRAIPELFNWSTKIYNTKDYGEIEVKLDEVTYEILKQRYSEIPRTSSNGEDIPYDIKPYLTEISSTEINIAYLESRFNKFIKDLSNGASDEKIQILLDELKSKFAVLSVENQRTADIILEDILSGSLKYEEGKTLNYYIEMYNKNRLLENIKKFSGSFGFNEKLLIKIMKYHLNRENLRRYGKFDQLMETLDRRKAKEAIERIENTTIPDYRVVQKAEHYLERFILERGFEI